MVSAWASEQGIALGQIATEEKSNEITAIPALIERIDIEGAVVTIDAMGCQKEIAKKIIKGGGDYVLAVKDNQPKLHQGIQAYFAKTMKDAMEQALHGRHETHETGHGREDDRYYCLTKLPDASLSRNNGLASRRLAWRFASPKRAMVRRARRCVISSPAGA
jgi:predicted transposase YbfD/YdcC